MAGDLQRSGFCALLGLPNVGKSTLLNRILGKRLAAVSPKPQTTRHRILGLRRVELEDGAAQIAFVDTPGLQQGPGALRRFLRDQAVAAASGCDVVLLVVDASDKRGRNPERYAMPDARPIIEATARLPFVVALNKIDRVGKPELLPLIAAWHDWGKARGEVIPICATTGDGVDLLERAVASRLPEGPALYPADMVTDRDDAFIAGELIREQLYHQLGQELPYAAAVVIDTIDDREDKSVAIAARIVVERESQKGIVVGRGGARIKELGIAARQAVSEALGRPVHLNLRVAVHSDWSQDERSLGKLGYSEDL